VFGERVDGLPGKGNAVDEEQHPGDRVGLEQALDERGGGAGLAGAGGHFDEQLAPAAGHFTAQGVDAGDLVGGAGDGCRWHILRVAAQHQRGGATLEVVLLEERS
jgi:hypothetical protein